MSSKKRCRYELWPLVLMAALAAADPPAVVTPRPHAIEPGKEVHQWIAKEGYNYFAGQITGANLGNYLGQWDNSQGDLRNTIVEGAAAEDKNNRPPLNQTLPYFRHFCAGADGAEFTTGYAGNDANVTQAQHIWTPAVNTYPTNHALSFYYLGHIVHLLGDMTVPAHTHNDGHPFGETFEDAMAANHRFQDWYYGGTRSGDWSHSLTLQPDLYTLIHTVADYTEDYPSDHVDGDDTRFYPSDYPTTWHRPGEVSRAGGISPDEITIIANDLMPYAMRRVAELYRLFYHAVDTSAPPCALNSPTGESADAPQPRATLDTLELSATASDPDSGVVIAGYRFSYAYYRHGAWSDWVAITPSPTQAVVNFTPPFDHTLYRFRVTAENGGGWTGESAWKYLRVDVGYSAVERDLWWGLR